MNQMSDDGLGMVAIVIYFKQSSLGCGGFTTLVTVSENEQ